MKRAIGLMGLMLLFYLIPSAFAQSLRISNNLELKLQNQLLSDARLYDSDLFYGHSREDFLRDYLQGADEAPLASLYLSAQPARFYGMRRIELSRLNCAVRGADLGMTLGMFMGAALSAGGILDERTSWYIAGATAAAGAILGGSLGADNPRGRVRYRWEE